MGTPPGKRGPSGDPKSQAFRQYQSRRAADAFDSDEKPTSHAWKSFVGERGERLRALLNSFDVLANPKYGAGPEVSLLLVRDVLQRMGSPLPELPAMRLVEWFSSPQGGRSQGWREVTSSLAQIAANDGRGAVVVGVGQAESAVSLAAVVYPDDASNPANPTVLMVTPQYALSPGTVLQGFRGEPVRYFALAQ